MTNNHLILIGYRATGKSTLAKMLAEKLNWQAVDSDVLIEERAGKPIARIFSEDGEPTFRDLESSVIAEVLLGTKKTVLATGGGAPVRPKNRELLRRSGFVVWLQASPETILKRMAADPTANERRPNLTDLPPLEEIKHVLQTRQPFYQEAAHFEIDTEQYELPEIVTVILANQ